LVAVVFEVAVTPVQRPQPGGLGVVQAGDRESGPGGAEVLAPRRSAFADGQMSWGDVTFDTDLTTGMLRDTLGAPALYPRDVELGKSARGHGAHDRSRQLQLCGRSHHQGVLGTALSS